MGRPFIVVGDKTSHGGTVISGDQTFLVHGKAVARVGDLTTCPKCKGTFPITSGAGDMKSMGQAPARDGDRTACGATLMASQGVATHSEGQTAGQTAPAEDAVTAQSLRDPTLVASCRRRGGGRGGG
ncbi:MULTISPECIES: PAAR domain-containing protein [unclassified Herbaspirillum]|uniref:PAAR domain-containing protein n=1 Tax=unclassified Herbaspirillum TaxID=2624150 RepID=UPI0015856DB4|nr:MULTISPECIES: PAAR domain-containing protein [unclassified Herbaspirillum]MCI1006671.1 PAAR domain-containing protein [Herbaspirillum sp. C7C8]NUT61347.1 PAAR domain-containing protein [Herbaspirillum sp. C9C3]